MKPKPGYILLNGQFYEAAEVRSVGLGANTVDVLFFDHPALTLKYDNQDDCLKAFEILLEEIDDALASVGRPSFSHSQRLQLHAGLEVWN